MELVFASWLVVTFPAPRFFTLGLGFALPVGLDEPFPSFPDSIAPPKERFPERVNHRFGVASLLTNMELRAITKNLCSSSSGRIRTTLVAIFDSMRIRVRSIQRDAWEIVCGRMYFFQTDRSWKNYQWLQTLDPGQIPSTIYQIVASVGKGSKIPL